jgi:hypothetical protein
MSKIPEGTQYIESGCGEKGFRKFEKGCWWFFEEHWRHVDWKMGDLIPVTAHPLYVTQPDPWTGEGLPPVGTVCELRAHKLTDWSAAKIEFAYRNVIVWDWIEEPSMNGLCTAYSHDVEFRPIRTAEQIAAEERRDFIESLAAELGGHWSEEAKSPHREIAAYLYNSGYRKQVQP